MMAERWVPKAEHKLEKPRRHTRLPDIDPEKEGGGLMNGANGWLQNKAGERVGLWVNGVESSFQVAGETAQSRTKREFYPHNFAQPMLTIRGQTPNNYQYNRLAAFVRDSHKYAISRNYSLLKLRIHDHTKRENFDIRAYPGEGGGTKGTHRGIMVDGYVTSVRRGAERFVYAHEYEFEFAILYADRYLGLQDEHVYRLRMKHIMQLIQNPKSGLEFIDPPTDKGDNSRPNDDSWDNGDTRPPGGGHGGTPPNQFLP